MDDLKEALFRTLKESDTNMLHEVLTRGAPPSFEEAEDYEPLLEGVVAAHGNLGVLEGLSISGADIRQNSKGLEGGILHWAVVGGQLDDLQDTSKRRDTLRDDMTSETESDTPNVTARTPVFRVVKTAVNRKAGPEDLASALCDIRMLIEAGADLAVADREGRTALHHATAAGLQDMTSLLLQHGAPVNAVDQSGETPLTLAVKNHHTPIMFLLLEKGADANARNRNGETLLHFLSMLNPDSFTPGHLALAEVLLTTGADVNAIDRRGLSPLSICAGSDNTDMARLLLRSGADPNLGNGASLREAVFYEHDAMLQLLLEAGAEAHFRDSATGKSALHLAAEEGYIFGVTALLDKGAPIDAVDNEGKAPLTMAINAKRPEIVRILLARGAAGHKAE